MYLSSAFRWGPFLKSRPHGLCSFLSDLGGENVGLRYNLVEEGPCKFSSKKKACLAVVVGSVSEEIKKRI